MVIYYDFRFGFVYLFLFFGRLIDQTLLEWVLHFEFLVTFEGHAHDIFWEEGALLVELRVDTFE